MTFDKSYLVAIEFKGADGIREVAFCFQEFIQASSKQEAANIMYAKTQAHRAVPGTLKILVREGGAV